MLGTLRARWPGRRLGRWLGGLVIALSFGFIGARLWQGGAWELIGPSLEPLLLATIAGALLYALSGLLLSAAWRQILAAERPPGPAAHYHAVYGRTQIAKYLPGNCFHFLGRQVLGRALGHSQAALALASLIEAALLTAVAASLALPIALDRFGAWSLVLPAAAALALALTLVAPRLLPARLWPGAGPPARRSSVLPTGRLLCALAHHAAFFIAAGGLLWLLAAAFDGSAATLPGPATWVGALALAWMAGFLVPGAAAGVGVREAVLMIALDGVLAPEAGAAVALAFRLVTTAGDGVLCALALALPLPSAASLRRPISSPKFSVSKRSSQLIASQGKQN